MTEYELFYLVAEPKESELDAIRSEVEKVVTGQGGAFLAPETSEKRKLAYAVKNETRGIYIARRFTLPEVDERADSAANPVEAMHRALQLSPNILRFLILRADDLPELKPIERVERPRTETRSGRYERRGAVRPMPQAPLPAKEEAKAVSQEEIDKQLKEKLDI